MKIQVKWHSILQRLLTFPYLLVILALIYVGVYFSLPFTPGNNLPVNPIGWWAWFDQSEYLKAANALYRLDFSADQYFYPPLYPALGSVFLFLSSKHPFFLVNLICLLWFAYVFIRLCDVYLPRAVGIFLLFASTIFEILIFENFVIPWTTTLSTALLASGILGLIWVQEIKEGKRSDLTHWQVLLVATSLGLMVPTRPVDALIGIVIGCAFIFSYLLLPKASVKQRMSPMLFLALTILGALLGPALFIGFNQLIYRAPLGNYVQVASSHGFFIADLPEKLYSIFLNAQPLYGEVGAGLVQYYPWLLLSLSGLVWILWRGDFVLRTIALAISTFLVLYLPYGDLLPSGMWRYLNIHYFKWTFAFFALFAALLLMQILRGVQAGSSWKLPCALFICIPLVLLSIEMKITTAPVLVNLAQHRTLTVELAEQPIDFIDLKGVTGTFSAIYFGEHALKLDEKPLKLNRDYRLLEHGADIRILFIRPVQGRILTLLPDTGIELHDEQLNAQQGSYHFAMGLPAFKHHLPVQKVPPAYRLSQVIDFSNQGVSHFYIDEGFSIPESQGRWSINGQARIDLRLINLLPEKQAQLVLTFKALLAASKPCQQVTISLNGQPIGTNRLCLQNQGDGPQIYRYDIPIGTIAKDGLVQIEIATPDSVSPRQLNINSDERRLGVFLQTLSIIQ